MINLSYLIDTNIFLEILLDQEKSRECQDILERAGNGKIECVVTHFTVHAIEGLLTDDLETVRKFVKNLENSSGIKIVDTTLAEEREIASNAEDFGLDFDDSMQFSVARKQGIEKIISLDKDFDKTSIERIEPSEII